MVRFLSHPADTVVPMETTRRTPEPRTRRTDLEIALAGLGIGYVVVFDGPPSACPFEDADCDRHAA